MTSDVPDLGTILSVWAHPDDEGYSCGGLMAAAVARGRRVVCVTATRGELGSTDESRWPAGPQLAEIRTQELTRSLAELGVTEHVWLDYPDGGCADVDADEAISRLRAIVDDVRPDTVLTFGPDGGTWHPDHIAVSHWATEAAAGTGAAVHHAASTEDWMAFTEQFVDASAVMMADKDPVVYPADALSIHAQLTGDLLDRKYRAMLQQESQIGPMLAMLGPDNYRTLLAEESFVLASR
ncbi:MAG TPA: PIG-L family deacetylase [Jatrophihabitans sp.]|nr:PIG-L family deacetylase [Jatrophihabitans sp.]